MAKVKLNKTIEEPIDNNSSNDDVILETKNLSISFRGLKAVSQFNVKIKKGQLYGLIGPNGAGKTTIFNLITGVYKPTEGEIIFCGKNVTNSSQMVMNRLGVSRTFQNIRLFNNMSVINNVMVAMSNLPEYRCSILTSILRLPHYFKNYNALRNKAKELLDVMGLLDVRNELSSNLPYGMQRKLEIARALASNPKLLLLDEPAAGMNPEETQELMDTIRFIRDHFQVTILLIEHDMKLVSGICEELTVLNFGEVLLTGETKKVLNDPRVVKAYLGD